MKSPNISLGKSLHWLFAFLEVVAICWAVILLGTLLVLRISGPKFFNGAWGLDIALKLAPDSYQLASISPGQSAFRIEHLHGTVPVNFAEAGAVVNLLAGLMSGILLCKSGMAIALCDLFRRLFRSVDRRELFTARNIGLLQKIGGLILILSVVNAVLDRSVQTRTADYIRSNLTARGAIAITSQEPPRTGWLWSSPANWMDLNCPELLIGLVLLGFGEALRQGVQLREENDLTV